MLFVHAGDKVYVNLFAISITRPGSAADKLLVFAGGEAAVEVGEPGAGEILRRLDSLCVNPGLGQGRGGTPAEPRAGPGPTVLPHTVTEVVSERDPAVGRHAHQGGE